MTYPSKLEKATYNACSASYCENYLRLDNTSSFIPSKSAGILPIGHCSGVFHLFMYVIALHRFPPTQAIIPISMLVMSSSLQMP